jgi:exopolysaccharide production protein ExoY
MLIVSGLLVRITMGRPVFHAERRIGFEGKPFTCYKFRTRPADEKDLLSHQNGCLQVSRRVRRLDHHSWNDFLGGCLRASGIDQLPQLLNVLRGDMSLIGPQPITPEHLSRYCAQAPEVLLARPGMIGACRHATRSLGCNATDIAADRHYVNHWSMRLDLKILRDALVRGPGLG